MRVFRELNVASESFSGYGGSCFRCGVERRRSEVGVEVGFIWVMGFGMNKVENI